MDLSFIIFTLLVAGFLLMFKDAIKGHRGNAIVVIGTTMLGLGMYLKIEILGVIGLIIFLVHLIFSGIGNGFNRHIVVIPFIGFLIINQNLENLNFIHRILILTLIPLSIYGVYYIAEKYHKHITEHDLEFEEKQDKNNS